MVIMTLTLIVIMHTKIITKLVKIIIKIITVRKNKAKRNFKTYRKGEKPGSLKKKHHSISSLAALPTRACQTAPGHPRKGMKPSSRPINQIHIALESIIEAAMIYVMADAPGTSVGTSVHL